MNLLLEEWYKMRKVQKWSEEEERFVRENYLQMTYKDMADHLGRSKKSIQWFCEKNNLIKKSPVQNSVGDRHGNFTLLEIPYRRENKTLGLVRCDCGTEKIIDINAIRCGKIKDCGCGFKKNIARSNAERARKILAFGESKTISRWVQDPRCQVKIHTLIRRLNDDWESEDAISTPNEWIPHDWTEQEIEYVKSNYTDMSMQEIADVCGVTKHRVRRLIGKLELKYPDKWSIGQKFGRMTILEIVGKTKFNNIIVLCMCECGKSVEVIASKLVRGATKSCGCYKDELVGSRSTTHGMSGTRLYTIWASMKQRCSNPSSSPSHWHRYGGRGIAICDEWINSFENFRDWALANGYNDELMIDRIDNDGNYTPENCRWVTETVQQNNKMTNRFVEAFGERKTLAEWSRDQRCQVNYDILSDRVNKLGWDEIEAIFTPKLR
jgi:hypothetical protein